MYTENCVDLHEDVEELVRLVKPDHVAPSNEYEALKLFSAGENRRFKKLLKLGNCIVITLPFVQDLNYTVVSVIHLTIHYED